jgi:hypothetical protein
MTFASNLGYEMYQLNSGTVGGRSWIKAIVDGPLLISIAVMQAILYKTVNSIKMLYKTLAFHECLQV